MALTQRQITILREAVGVGVTANVKSGHAFLVVDHWQAQHGMVEYNIHCDVDRVRWEGVPLVDARVTDALGQVINVIDVTMPATIGHAFRPPNHAFDWWTTATSSLRTDDTLAVSFELNITSVGLQAAGWQTHRMWLHVNRKAQRGPRQLTYLIGDVTMANTSLRSVVS